MLITFGIHLYEICTKNVFLICLVYFQRVFLNVKCFLKNVWGYPYWKLHTFFLLKICPVFSHSEWWHVYDAFSVLFLNKKIENIFNALMTDQFECAFVTGFRDKTRRICHIYAIHYNWKRRFDDAIWFMNNHEQNFWLCIKSSNCGNVVSQYKQLWLWISVALVPNCS
jgi:hypothetical protein